MVGAVTELENSARDARGGLGHCSSDVDGTSVVQGHLGAKTQGALVLF